MGVLGKIGAAKNVNNIGKMEAANVWRDEVPDRDIPLWSFDTHPKSEFGTYHTHREVLLLQQRLDVKNKLNRLWSWTWHSSKLLETWKMNCKVAFFAKLIYHDWLCFYKTCFSNGLNSRFWLCSSNRKPINQTWTYFYVTEVLITSIIIFTWTLTRI